MKLFDIFVFTINAIFPLILIILLGYFLKRTGLLTKDFLRTGNKLVFRVLLPSLLFVNIVSLEGLDGIPWNAVIYVMCILTILVLLGFLLASITPEPKQKGVMMQCVFRSNFALIGVPLAELIGGSEGVAAAAILSVFTIPVYNTLGVIVLSSFLDKDKEAFKRSRMSSQFKEIAKNPLIIGVLLGLICLIIKQVFKGSVLVTAVSNAEFLKTTFLTLSRAATPISLIVLGGQFEFNRIAGYSKQIILATTGRTVVSPLISIGGVILLNRLGVAYFSPAVVAAFISLFGTPVAVASAIMADEMGNDGQLAAQLVVWTSLVSIFTLFIFIFMSKVTGII